MEQRKRTMKKGATKVTAIALAIAAVMALALCGCASQGDTSKSDIPAEDRTNAKQVIMAAGDLFTMITWPHRRRQPATISQNDPAFAEFWSELLQYKKVADLDVQNAEIVTDITAVEAATAREDSTQTNYRYAIKSATMTVNGKTITYDASKGFSA
ncbi:MAG: hypothetical protein ACLUE1_06250 [Adlercreutzia equolifaciens]